MKHAEMMVVIIILIMVTLMMMIYSNDDDWDGSDGDGGDINNRLYKHIFS